MYPQVLDRKPDMEDVAILNDILFTFKPYLPRFTCGNHVAFSHQFGIADHFCADEASCQIAVNGPGRIDSICATPNGPGPDFIFTHGEEGM